MVDYRIILQILHNHLLECSGHTSIEGNRPWVLDENMIVFQSSDSRYHERIADLNALQFLQRTRILFTMLSFPN